METTTKGIRDPLNENYVDIRATGEARIKQDSGLKVRVKSNNSEIGVIDNNFCILLEDNKSVTKITLNPQNKKEVVFIAYYKDENGNPHKKEEEPYAIVNIADQEIKK